MRHANLALCRKEAFHYSAAVFFCRLHVKATKYNTTSSTPTRPKTRCRTMAPHVFVKCTSAPPLLRPLSPVLRGEVLYVANFLHMFCGVSTELRFPVGSFYLSFFFEFSRFHFPFFVEIRQIGSVRGPKHFASDQTVFHRDDVPAARRERKKEVKEVRPARVCVCVSIGNWCHPIYLWAPSLPFR